MTDYRIRALEAGLDSSDFDCGVTALDDYIKRYASQDVKRDVARVFVATKQGSERLAGFFTLSAATVRCSDLPQDLRKKLPQYPILVALLGRLAVDKVNQGQGLGSILLADACQKVAQASQVLAVAGLIVDAKDENAAKFYRQFGFNALQGGHTSRLLLPIRAFPPKWVR